MNPGPTYDWYADQWSVPMNLIMNKIVTLDQQSFQFFVGARYWLVSPEDAGPTRASRVD